MAGDVKLKEFDASFYTTSDVTLKIAAVTPAQWGSFERTTVTNTDDYVEAFGKPIDSDTLSQPWLTIREFLRKGANADVSRVEQSGAAKQALGSLRGGRSTTLSTVVNGVCTVVGGGDDTFDSAGANFVTDGVKAGMYLVIDEPDAGGGEDDNNGFYKIITVAATKLTIDGDWPDQVAAAASANINATVETTKCGGTLTNTAASGTDGATGTSSSREFDSASAGTVGWAGTGTGLTGVEAGFILVIDEPVVAGGEDADDGTYLVASVTDNDTIIVDRDWPEGGKSGLDFALYKDTIYETVPASGTGKTTINTGTFEDANAYFSSWGVVAGDIVVIDDAGVDTENGTYIVVSVDSETKLTLLAYFSATTATTLDYAIYPASVRFQAVYKGERANNFTFTTSSFFPEPDTWTLTLYESGAELGQWTNLTRSNVTSEDFGDNYVELVASSSVVANTTEPVLESGILFNGGNNGTGSIANSDKFTALERLRDVEQTKYDVLLYGGESNETVQALMQEIVEERKVSVAFIDPPTWATAYNTRQEVQNWTNGVTGSGRSSAINSDRLAIWWPEWKTYDEYNETDRWLPPSAAAIYTLTNSYNEFNGGPQLPNAGTNSRGIIPHCTGLRIELKKSERKLMTDDSSHQILNPIAKKEGVGYYVAHYKTAARTSSALDRLNNRITLNTYMREAGDAVAPYTMQLEDDVLYQLIQDALQDAATPIINRKGFQNFEAKCDASTNTGAQEHEAIGSTWLNFYDVAEDIILKFIVTPTGVDFEEFIGTLAS